MFCVGENAQLSGYATQRCNAKRLAAVSGLLAKFEYIAAPCGNWRT